MTGACRSGRRCRRPGRSDNVLSIGLCKTASSFTQPLMTGRRQIYVVPIFSFFLVCWLRERKIKIFQSSRATGATGTAHGARSAARPNPAAAAHADSVGCNLRPDRYRSGYTGCGGEPDHHIEHYVPAVFQSIPPKEKVNQFLD